MALGDCIINSFPVFLAPYLILFGYFAAALGWVHLTSQTTVSRSLKSSAAIVARLVATIGLCYAVASGLFGMTANSFAAVMLLVLLVCPIATYEGVPAGHELEFAIANALVLPIYILKQFILGFPDRDRVILSPPGSLRPADDLLRLVASTGTVAATLRPCGTVQIDDVVYSATAADGRYLEAGTQVKVTGVRNSMLSVVPIALEEL